MRYRILQALMEGKGSRAQVVDFVTGAKLADGRGEKVNRKVHVLSDVPEAPL